MSFAQIVVFALVFGVICGMLGWLIGRVKMLEDQLAWLLADPDEDKDDEDGDQD